MGRLLPLDLVADELRQHRLELLRIPRRAADVDLGGGRGREHVDLVAGAQHGRCRLRPDREPGDVGHRAELVEAGLHPGGGVEVDGNPERVGRPLELRAHRG
jgi:hypothetical protein